MRQLSALPLKVSIFVVDGAREQPFIEGGQPIASGLALVEPDPHMLIAFNSAPGTVAPEEPGPYGVYAQSLAKMIRTGGLPLPELFMVRPSTRTPRERWFRGTRRRWMLSSCS